MNELSQSDLEHTKVGLEYFVYMCVNHLVHLTMLSAMLNNLYYVQVENALCHSSSRVFLLLHKN